MWLQQCSRWQICARSTARQSAEQAADAEAARVVGTAGAAADPEGTSSGWACDSCTFRNHHLLPSCELCETPRPPADDRYDRYDRYSTVTPSTIPGPRYFPICITDLRIYGFTPLRPPLAGHPVDARLRINYRRP